MSANTGITVFISKSILVFLLPINFLLSAGDGLSGYGIKYLPAGSSAYDIHAKAKNALASRFECFRAIENHARYSITLCGDIPDNDHPERVSAKREPGHVFIILTKEDTTASSQPICEVFGFYPRRPASSLIFKNVHCVILDNGDREYNVSIYKDLSTGEFELVMAKAVELCRKRYNINKYNCYDYALEIFNSIPGIEKLPISRVKFPFIFGSGGSPCALFRDLKRLKDNGSVWAPYIQFGVFKSPVSYSHQ